MDPARVVHRSASVTVVRTPTDAGIAHIFQTIDEARKRFAEDFACREVSPGCRADPVRAGPSEALVLTLDECCDLLNLAAEEE